MSQMHVVVIGAGAFGGWTALTLAQRGVRVTLVDAWGPGNARSSSGGSTRIIRATYGSHQVYKRMAVQALSRWQEYDEKWSAGLLRQTGAIWLLSGSDRFGVASRDSLRAEGVRLEEIEVPEAAR